MIREDYKILVRPGAAHFINQTVNMSLVEDHATIGKLN